MRAPIKLLLLLLWLPPMMLVITPFWLVNWEAMRQKMARLTFLGINYIFAIRIHMVGKLPDYRPMLVVSNHCSYLDILVLGGALPVAFMPKQEIARWPVIGFCCFLAGCVFVERKLRAIAETRVQLVRKLRMGRVMCLFPEGTTNNGNDLKPFKSSLFSLADVDTLAVQPVSICYTHRNGHRLDAQGRSSVAWYGDETALVPHVWQFLKSRSIDVTLSIHPMLENKAGVSRKALCQQSETIIRTALMEQMT